MQWLMLLAVALGCATLDRHLKPVDEIHALAIGSAGILCGLWGFAIAPILAQFTLELITFGWLQVNCLRI